MRIETPADACAALAVLIAGADEVGTMEEGRFLFETVAGLSMFDHLDRGQFAQLMADVADDVWSSFPTHGNRLSEDGVSDLLRLVCEALPRELRTEAFQAAVGLARSDGTTAEEARLLQRLCDELEIDSEFARGLLGHDA